MDIGIRVRVLSSKLDHPSAQRLDAEQYERLRAEVRTLRWVVRERLHRPEWADLIAEVEGMVERVERLDPALSVEVEVPPQAGVSQGGVGQGRVAADVGSVERVTECR
ncbi:hypothetical protein ADK67_46570 [Saccharothrix sp. NRRL B-16348]|uniref:hypothetical protein n=1 Tax=Saccharothrix sp. NRRL B-16348 TaxID=1415542 RepID=UPI0006B02890|nr:hypothetical protein [Saccharothrix sp. NRRL B-16348]KOX12697.1 hypothetical protein ADK67_46570 [Saccharothrix sp. NRRL B-16348]